MGVEGFFGGEVFEGEVHTVAPVVTRVGRHVYKFLCGIFAAYRAIHREPVLQGDDAEHGGRFEMQVEDTDRKSVV